MADDWLSTARDRLRDSRREAHHTGDLVHWMRFQVPPFVDRLRAALGAQFAKLANWTWRELRRPKNPFTPVTDYLVQTAERLLVALPASGRRMLAKHPLGARAGPKARRPFRLPWRINNTTLKVEEYLTEIRDKLRTDRLTSIITTIEPVLGECFLEHVPPRKGSSPWHPGHYAKAPSRYEPVAVEAFGSALMLMSDVVEIKTRFEAHTSEIPWPDDPP